MRAKTMMTKCRRAGACSKRASLLVAMGLGVIGAPADARANPQPLQNGDVLSGELLAMKIRVNGKRAVMFQLTSEPRRIPGPDSRCNLETGPETFQLVTHNDSDIRQLKAVVGKTVSVKVGGLSCAQAAGQVTDALIGNWSLVPKR